jgi:hypothetical protein
VEEPLFSKGTLAGFRKRPIERTAGRIGQLVAANTGLAPITTAIGPENSPARPDPVSRRARITIMAAVGADRDGGTDSGRKHDLPFNRMAQRRAAHS